MESVGIAAAGGPAAEDEGDPERQGGEGVGRVVDGVGEEGDGAAQEDDDELPEGGEPEPEERELHRPDPAPAPLEEVGWVLVRVWVHGSNGIALGAGRGAPQRPGSASRARATSSSDQRLLQRSTIFPSGPMRNSHGSVRLPSGICSHSTAASFSSWAS